MKPITLPTANDECIPHRVYDLSIPDINKRREASQVFRSGLAAANWLGIEPKKLFRSRKPGTTINSPIYNKRFAVRIEKATVMVPALVRA